MKKFLIFFSFLFFLSLSVYADGSETDSIINTGDLNLTVAKEIPKGIQPIVINSQAEFDDFVKNVKNNNYAVEFGSDNSTKENIQKKYKTVHVTKSKGIGANFAGHYAGKIVLHGDITISTTHGTSPYSIKPRGLYSEIVSASGYTSLEGFVYSFEWDEKEFVEVISHDKQSVELYSHGTLKYYLLINGFINIYNENVDISYSYHL